jgi:hypothetical protein
MKRNFILLFLADLLMLVSCHGQTKAIGDAPLNLEKFNFDTKIADLYPDKYKSAEYKGYYEINGAMSSHLVQQDSTYTDDYSEDEKAIGLEYRQQSSTSIDKMAVFGNQIFNKINVATTLDGKIKVVNAVAEEFTEQQSAALIKNLVKRYGAAKQLKNRWDETLTMYEWTAEHRIIRFVTAFKDGSGTIKLVMDKNKQLVSSDEKDEHYVGYLFIINPNFKNEIFGKMKIGDFLYIDEQ